MSPRWPKGHVRNVGDKMLPLSVVACAFALGFVLRFINQRTQMWAAAS